LKGHCCSRSSAYQWVRIVPLLKNMWNCSLTQQILSHSFYDWKLCELFLLSGFLICHAIGWTPYKDRYITGSSTCSTKELSIHLTKILSAVKEGQQKYCETVLIICSSE
jgi:hypothetical protein